MIEPLKVPRLERPPLILRPFEARDVGVVAEAASDPLIPLITSVPATPDLDACRAFIVRQRRRAEDREGYSFVIVDAASDEALGHVGLWLRDEAAGRASLGYWLAPRRRGSGLARQALVLVATWGLRLPGIHRLELFIEPTNVASWRTAEGAGFEREGLLRSWMTIGDRRRDMYVYSRTSE